jgi:PAS domain S-box-containing protein
MPKRDKDHILIVDDRPQNIFALEQVLAKADRSIISAGNGKEALKFALNQKIDLIILDVQMPELDGFEVAQILKSNKRTKDIPVIFVSAEMTGHESVMKGFGEGAIDYLQKPLNADITQAKVSILLQLQKQKRELLYKTLALEKYALLINNSADLICIIEPQKLRFEEVNEAVTKLLGYTPSEIKGTSLLLYLFEEDRTKVQQLVADNKDNFFLETQIYCKDRSIKWLSWNIVCKNGTWFANARDITEIKEVEEIRNYLSIVVKQSKDAIYLHNADGKIISWNKGAEEIYGFSEEEALRMFIWNIVPEQLLSQANEVIQSILKGGKVELLHTKRITKFGKLIDVMFSASVITDVNGDLRSVAITERDITQQILADREIKQLNTDLKGNVAELELTNNELESFSYSVSHDLRAPLRGINGYAQMILEDYGSGFNEEMKRLFLSIQRNAAKMGALIDDLLEFSRLGRKELTKVPIDLFAMAEQVIKEQTKENNWKGTITVDSLLPAEGDPTLLAQVFTNLVSNAIKYSGKKEKPTVHIGSYEENNEHVYFVNDNGAGFNMEYAHKLFGVFQRLHSSNEFEGTGVGLAIVQRVITRHRGRVWAEGKLNEGAKFYFSLPKPESNNHQNEH